MLIRKPFLEKMAKGETTLAFRSWRKPTVRAGGTLRTELGVLAIHEVSRVARADLTDHDASQAGFDSLEALLEDLHHQRPGELYRITLSFAGSDPRITLRDALPDDPTLQAIHAKLLRYDRHPADGVWTRRVLTLIGMHAGLPAGELAAKAGLEKERLKLLVRKLKELGLTQSLQPGYRLSPRGLKVLESRWPAR